MRSEKLSFVWAITEVHFLRGSHGVSQKGKIMILPVWYFYGMKTYDIPWIFFYFTWPGLGTLKKDSLAHMTRYTKMTLRQQSNEELCTFHASNKQFSNCIYIITSSILWSSMCIPIANQSDSRHECVWIHIHTCFSPLQKSCLWALTCLMELHYLFKTSCCFCACSWIWNQTWVIYTTWGIWEKNCEMLTPLCLAKLHLILEQQCNENMA